jgi:glycosyltransferase involved in cell wall biosynthesis
VPRLDDGEPGASAVTALVRGLARAYRTTLVAGPGGPGAAELEAAGARLVAVDLAGGGPLGGWRAASRLEALVRETDVALIHAHGEAAAVVAARVARRTRRPWIAGPAAAAPPSPRWLAAVGGDGRGGAERVVVPSRDLADRLEAGGVVSAARLRVVPPAIDSERFDPARLGAERLERARRAWGAAAETPVVLLPAAVAEGGGHLELLRALKRRGRDDALAVFAGACDTDGVYRKQIELFARTAGLEARMRIVDAAADRPAAFAAARVVALPATGTPRAFEPAALEAQATGTPVIVHAHGALPEALMPAATGWLVDVGDTAGLAEALDLALAMPEEVRARTATRARAFVATEFGPERAAAAVGDVYGELLDATAR